MENHPARETTPDKQEHTGFGEMVIGCGWFLVVGSILIPAYQAYLWLRDGSWTPLETSIILPRVLPIEFSLWIVDENASWVGFRKIIAYIVFDMPLILFVVLLGLSLLLFAERICPGKESVGKISSGNMTRDPANRNSGQDEGREKYGLKRLREMEQRTLKGKGK